jgi:predicted Zn-dependent protease
MRTLHNLTVVLLPALAASSVYACGRTCEVEQAFLGRSRTVSVCERSSQALEAQHGGLYTDAQAVRRICRVGSRLVGRIDPLPVTCRFRILNTSRRNAYSLSCGCVYVTRGLYEELEFDDQLAAVLAHELGHVWAQDGKRPCGGGECQLEREVRADERAARYLRAAGYPQATLLEVITLVAREQPSGWADRRRSELRTKLVTGPAIADAERVTASLSQP